MTCIQTKLTKIHKVNNRTVESLKLAINALILRWEALEVIYSDKESAAVSIAKVKQDDLNKQYKISYHFYPQDVQ